MKKICVLLVWCLVPLFGSGNMAVLQHSALRMEEPFFLESGKEEAGFYVQVDRSIKDPEHGTVHIMVRGVPPSAPLTVWARVWWESSGESSFKVRAGGNSSAVCSGRGFSDTWSWVRASGTLTFAKNQHTCTVEYIQGGFCIDRLFFARKDSAAPRNSDIRKSGSGPSVYFSDDFMREKKKNRQNLGSWKPVSGTWSQYMISNVKKGRKSSQPSKSANGFALRGKPDSDEAALILNGRLSWRNYSLSGSISAAGPGAAGLVVNFQDRNNYYLFTLGFGTEEKTRFVKMLNGKEHVIAEHSLCVEPGNYYSVSVRAVQGSIVCRVDDTVLFSVKDSSILCGRIGLCSVSGEYTVFDDILAVSSVMIKEDFENWDYGVWKTLSGEWFVRWPEGSAGLFASLGEDIPSSDREKSAVLVGRGEDPALIVIGEPEWVRYTGSASVGALHPGSSAGLAFNVIDSDRYWLFTGSVSLDRRSGKKNITLSVNRIEDGHKKKVESAVLDYIPGTSRFGLRAEQGKAHFLFNGKKVLQVSDADIAGGRFGLAAGSPDGIAFDDVVIDFTREKEPDSWHFVVPVFTEEDTMKNWARQSSDWVRGGNDAFRNMKDIYGDVGVELTVKDLSRQYSIMIKNSIRHEDGYRLNIREAETGTLLAEIFRRGSPVAADTYTLSSSQEERNKNGIPLLLEKDGHYITAKIEGKTAAEFRDPAPLNSGRRVAVRIPGMRRLDNVRVISRNLKNYLFTVSPVDWYTRGGTWKITNRWKCDPRWSWYGGRGARKAVLWNKRGLKGDFTIDLFMSMQMDKRGRPHYYHPGEMNITVCADGENLGSGYSFLFGGNRGTVTRILKNGETAAETRERLFLPPSTRDGWQPSVGPRGLHRRWFHLTVVRRGNLFEYYLDNQLMCSFTDKDPLRGKRFGIWTYDNGIMVARVRVSAERISERKTNVVSADTEEQEEEQKDGHSPEQTVPFAFTSTTHPLGREDEKSRASWIIRESRKEAREKDYAARAEKVRFRGREGCIRVTNRISGGRFSLKLFDGSRKVESLQRLSFDYLLPSDRIKLDLFLYTDKGWFYVRFSGDSHPFSPGNPPFYPVRLGDIDAQADGEFHSVSLDLYNLFKHFTSHSDLSGTVIKSIFLGHACYGYTDAGVKGNFKGDSYYLDRVRFTGSGGDTFRASWKIGSAGYSEYAFVLDSDPDTVPDSETAVQAASFERESLGGGTHYFHICGVSGSGPASPVLHYRIDVDKKPPAVQEIEFIPRGARMRIVDEETGIDWNSLNILVMNRGMKYGDSGLSVFPVKHEARIDFADAGIVLEQGDVHVSVVSVRDRASNALRKSFYSSTKYSYGKDTVPPEVEYVLPPRMKKLKYDFEKTGDLWTPMVSPDRATVLLDRNVSWKGLSSMALIHTGYASPFEFRLSRRINCMETPYITFMYRLMPDVRVNLGIDSVKGNFNMQFSDRNTDSRTIGKIKDVRRDAEWRIARLNIRDAILSKSDGIPSLDVTGIYFQDIQWRAADPMTRFWIDDFCLHSVYENSGGDMKVWIRASDTSGIGTLAYRFSLLASESGMWNKREDPKPDATGFYPVKIPAHLEGERNIEAYAVDRAGNKSAVQSFPLILDNSSPRIASIRPVPMSRAADSRISLHLKDDYSGIKHKSVIMNVNGTDYRIGHRLVSYSAKTSILSFDLQRADSVRVFPDTKKVKVGIYAEDGAGHPVKNMWYWTMDYTKDAQPPPVLRPTALPCLKHLETFESSSGEWKDRSGGRGGHVSVTDEDSMLGKKCLKVTNRSGHGDHSCYVRARSFNGLAYDCVSFDYRITKLVHIDFCVLVKGTWYSIEFASPKNRYTRIGRAECVKDGTWHHTEFNLGDMLRKQFPDSSETITVQNMIMGEFDPHHRNKHGASFFIDNFALFPSKERNPFRFGWKSVYDPTGIKTHVYRLSRKAKDIPDTPCGRKTAVELPDPGQGAWYFHLSAEDNNGNRSTPAVFGPVKVKTPGP